MLLGVMSGQTTRMGIRDGSRNSWKGGLYTLRTFDAMGIDGERRRRDLSGGPGSSDFTL